MDRLTVLVRDPYWVWFHWFLEGPASGELRRRIGAEPRWFLVVEGEDTRFEYSVPRRCPFWWVRVEPGRYYRARLAARTEGGEITVCRTEPFRTPRPWVKLRRPLPPAVADFVVRHGFPVGPAGTPAGEGLGVPGRPPSPRPSSRYPHMPSSGGLG